jgi:hypothetical protein
MGEIMDLMDMVKGAVSKQIMGQIGGMLGTDEKKTSSVFETAAGSILGGLIKKSGTPNGARDVFDMASKQDDSVLDKLGDILGGGQATEDFQKSGGGILEGVFGKSNQSGILGALAKALGLDEKLVGTLMKVLAPIVMGVIGKYVKSKALDAVGLGSFLGEQKKSLGFMPSSLTSSLGFGDLLGNVGDAGKAVAGAANVAKGVAGDAAQSGGNLMKLLVPLLILAALAFGAWKLLPMLTGGANKAIQGAVGKIEMPEIPGLDLSGIEGFDMGSLGAAGPALTQGFGEISSGFEGLKESGEEGAGALAEKITGFTGTIDGLGLADLPAAGKKSAMGLIGKFIELVKGLLGGQSEGIQGILKPAVDALIEKLNPFTG